MSVFRHQTLSCPKCKKPVDFQAVFSVNADRRPDLRDAIIEGTFQQEACPKCGTRFRLQPDMTYFDVSRKQWLMVRPITTREDWPQAETQARDLFSKAFGPNAPASLRDEMSNMTARVTFGWAGVREKLLSAQHQLDDLNLELMKLALVRGSETVQVTDTTELRLVNVEGDELVLAWIDAVPETVVETMRVPRALYDEIAADVAWDPLRTELKNGFFVDFYRFIFGEPADAANGSPKEAPAPSRKPASKKPTPSRKPKRK